MSGVLRPGALCWHPKHGAKQIEYILPIEPGRPRRRVFVGLAARGLSFDQMPDGSFSDGWVLVGDGFAPEGAHLAWVTEAMETDIRCLDLVAPHSQTVMRVRSEFARLNPVSVYDPESGER